MDQPDRPDMDLPETLDVLLAVGRRLEVGGRLSRTAAYTLATLSAHGPVRLTDLAAREAVSQPAMTGLVQRLQTAGLVTRSPDPHDGRGVLVDVTAAGRALVDARRTAYADLAARMVDRLGHDDCRALDAVLPALRHLVVLAMDELPSGAPDAGPRPHHRQEIA